MDDQLKEIFKNNARDKEPALSIDWDLYEHMLAESDLTDAEKKEFIETLWSIVVAFVDLGFGVHPVQQAPESSGQDADIALIIQRHVLSSEGTLPNNQTTKPVGAVTRSPGARRSNE
ncbi:MAG: hypothetical protein JJ891_16235 [Rhizobiaceae bacterium]|jgi:hypothetical protein|nr:hypothetical protein [Rhizobiaceae bacterium]